MADSKGYYQYTSGDTWNQQFPDAGKNLWLGQRSCSHTFDQIVALVKGRWPMVDKNYWRLFVGAHRWQGCEEQVEGWAGSNRWI